MGVVHKDSNDVDGQLTSGSAAFRRGQGAVFHAEGREKARLGIKELIPVGRSTGLSYSGQGKVSGIKEPGVCMVWRQ